MRCGYLDCKKRPYVEVHMMSKHSWCYLCKEHYELVKIIDKDKEAGFCELTWFERIRARLSF
jgi:hypothetical protein